MRATVITDASFCSNTRLGGWAAWIRHDGDKGPFCRSGTIHGTMKSSTVAEIKAAMNGIWLARQVGATHILLQSDCMAVIHLVQRQTKNQELLDLWASCMDREDMQGIVSLTVRHVKAHGRIHDRRTYVNDWCDKHAKRHMMNARRRRLECTK